MGVLTRATTALCLATLARADDPVAEARPSNEDWQASQEAVADEAKAITDKKKKMAAVNKVVDLLEGLRGQVMSEGEKEAKTYNKFACFCKDTMSDKTDSIASGKDAKDTLSAGIVELSAARDGFDVQIAEFLEDIKEAEQAMKENQFERSNTNDIYRRNDADLRGAIEALKAAIGEIKASKGASLMQVQTLAKNVRSAVLLADAMGLAGASEKKNLGMFLQDEPDNSVPTQDYKFHSGDIIKTLEGLQADFRAQKVEVDKSEVESVKVHDAFMQEKKDLVSRKNHEMNTAKKTRAEKVAQIESNNQRLSVVSADLLDDQQYLMELSQMCSDKAVTYDQRTKVRQDELSALTSAMDIIKTTVSEKTSAKAVRFAQQGVSVRLAEVMARSPKMMAEIEAEAEAADAEPASFLQLPNSDDGRQAVSALLKSTAASLKSAELMDLASKIAAVQGSDPFAKVKTLIQELVERLLQEEAGEANHKGWCDKATVDAEQKRGYAADSVADLNGQMAELEATRDQLTEETSVLSSEIDELKANREAATTLRDLEKTENAATVEEADLGLQALKQAIDILDKYYKTAAKGSVELSLAQGPADDAPDAGFDNGEAYTGSQGSATGILGMLAVIESDFERTISETEKAEAQAAADYMLFMTDSGKSLAEKEMANSEKTKQKDAAMASLEEADENLKSEVSILKTSITELLELKPVCVDTGMSYEDRVRMREEEITALKKADCILAAYAEFGPDGAANAC
jgi:chromosome segregation ATPase